MSLVIGYCDKMVISDLLLGDKAECLFESVIGCWKQWWSMIGDWKTLFISNWSLGDNDDQGLGTSSSQAKERTNTTKLGLTNAPAPDSNLANSITEAFLSLDSCYKYCL